MVVKSLRLLHGRGPSNLHRAHIHHISHVVSLVVSNRLLIVTFNTNMIMSSIHVISSASAVVGAVCEVADE